MNGDQLSEAEREAAVLALLVLRVITAAEDRLAGRFSDAKRGELSDLLEGIAGELRQPGQPGESPVQPHAEPLRPAGTSSRLVRGDFSASGP